MEHDLNDLSSLRRSKPRGIEPYTIHDVHTSCWSVYIRNRSVTKIPPFIRTWYFTILFTFYNLRRTTFTVNFTSDFLFILNRLTTPFNSVVLLQSTEPQVYRSLLRCLTRFRQYFPTLSFYWYLKWKTKRFENFSCTPRQLLYGPVVRIRLEGSVWS